MLSSITRDLVSTDKQQAEDRIHRIGTKTSPNIYTIITKDTMDERVHDILYKKEGYCELHCR